jgi:hypothetical protein
MDSPVEIVQDFAPQSTTAQTGSHTTPPRTPSHNPTAVSQVVQKYQLERLGTNLGRIHLHKPTAQTIEFRLLHNYPVLIHQQLLKVRDTHQSVDIIHQVLFGHGQKCILFKILPKRLLKIIPLGFPSRLGYFQCLGRIM